VYPFLYFGMEKMITLLYLDNHLVVTKKPAGLLVQGNSSGDITLLQLAKDFIKEKYNKPGKVYLGLVHRLDRPTSGILCFAKTSKAAARLSKQFRQKTTDKKYFAIVQGSPPDRGTWIDKMQRQEQNSRITREGKTAELSFQKLAEKEGFALMQIDLKTGRHHQIRVQFAHRGFPVIGDFRYGSKTKFPNQSIGLHAYSLTLDHPTTKERMTFFAGPEDFWPEFFRKKANEIIEAEKYHSDRRNF